MDPEPIVCIVAFLLVLGIGFESNAGLVPIANGGFEDDADTNGLPDGWRLLSPSVIYHQGTGPPFTRSGTGAIEVGHSGLAQDFPFLPNRYYAARSYSRGDEGGEQGWLALRFDRADPTLKRTQSTLFVETVPYLPLIVCEHAPEDTISARLELGSFRPGWVWYDDVSLFSEQIANPSFEEDVDADGAPDGWLILGDPLISPVGIGGSTAVRVSSEGIVLQESAVCTDYDYLWTFRLRGDAGGESAVLAVEWFGPLGDSMGVDSAMPTVDADWTLCSIQARAPRNNWSFQPAMLLVATMGTGSSSERVWVDHVYADRFLLVSEDVFPNGDGVYDSVEMRLRFDEDTYVEIDLKDSGGGVVAVVEAGTWYTAGPHDLTWEPPGWIASATYELEVRFEDGLGQRRVLTRPLVIDENAVFEGSSALVQSRFRYGFYCWGTPYGFGVPEMTLQLVREAALLGANTVIVATHTNTRQSLLELAESVGVDVALGMQIAFGWATKTASEKGLRITDFKNLITPYVEAVRNYPALFAYYTKDEPTVEFSPRVFAMNHIFGELDSGHPRMNVLNDIDLGPQKLDLVRPPVYIYDDYAIQQNAPLGSLGAFISRIELAASHARQRSIPFWPMLQAYSKPGSHRNPTRAETLCMAHISLANGANGLFYFVLGGGRQTPDTPSMLILYGLVDVQFSPGPLYDDIQGVFQFLADQGDLFLDLEAVPDLAITSPPAYCKTQEDSLGDRYLWLINLDCLEPRTIGADLTEAVATGHDVLANRLLVWKNSGQRIEVELPPGGAALVKLGEPPPEPPIPSTDLVPAFGSEETYDLELHPVSGPGPDDTYRAMTYADGLLYLYTQSLRLDIWDCLSPVRQLLSQVPLGVPGQQMRVHGDLLIISDSTYGFALVDVGDPTDPQLVGKYVGYNGNAVNADIVGDLIYVAGHNYGVSIVDASNPADMAIISRIETPGLAQDIHIRDGIAYVADGVGGLTVLDIGNPLSPVVLANLRIPGDDARQIILRGDVAYVIGKPTVVAAVDVIDPASPVLLHTEHTFHIERASAGYRTLVVADRAAGIALLDINDPAVPRLRRRARVEGFPIDVLYADNWLFTINHEFVFHQYEFRDPFDTAVDPQNWTFYK